MDNTLAPSGRSAIWLLTICWLRTAVGCADFVEPLKPQTADGATDAGRQDASRVDAGGADAEWPVLSPEDFCAGIIVLADLRRAECWGGTREEYSRRSDEDRLEEACELLLEAISSARRVFDWQEGAACLDYFRSASCADLETANWPSAGWLQAPLEPCQLVVKPQRTFGQSCEMEEDCVGDATCDNTPSCTGDCSRTCLRLTPTPVGGSCDCLNSCSDASFCGAGVCETWTPIGEMCSISDSPCAPGTYCSQERQQCEQLSLYGACDRRLPNVFPCSELSLVCAGPVEESTCRPPKRIGDSCVPGWLECRSAAYCSAAGVCTILPAAGEPCGDDGPESSKCWSGFCNNFTCEPPAFASER